MGAVGIKEVLVEAKQAITDLTFLVLKAMDGKAKRELVERGRNNRLLTRSHASMYEREINAVVASLEKRVGPGTDAETRQKIEDLILAAKGLKKIAKI